MPNGKIKVILMCNHATLVWKNVPEESFKVYNDNNGEEDTENRHASFTSEKGKQVNIYFNPTTPMYTEQE